MQTRSHSCRAQRGVTLIEVLVALVIVAVGLLGLAGMQVRGLSIQKDAHGRAIATQLALDLADRMRANRDPATRVPPAEYAFTTAYPTGAPGLTDAPANCAAAICNQAQQAEYDLRGVGATNPGWLDRVTSALPGGWAQITAVDATRQVWDVRVMWLETGIRGRVAAQAAAGDASAAATLTALNTADNCRTGVTGLPAAVECQLIRVRP